MRATPRVWKQPHGSTGKMQQTLFGHARTLRIQLQERLGMEITSNDCIFPWIVKHSQFLLNRYMTHEAGQASYFRRWKKDYQTGLREFGETVLFRMPGKLKDKADTAWLDGIWLGKDTEADESLVFGNGTMQKFKGSHCATRSSFRTVVRRGVVVSLQNTPNHGAFPRY